MVRIAIFEIEFSESDEMTESVEANLPKVFRKSFVEDVRAEVAGQPRHLFRKIFWQIFWNFFQQVRGQSGSEDPVSQTVTWNKMK